MVSTDTVRMMTRYKTWADEMTFSAVKGLPEGEATKERPTLFKNMVHTLNHTYVIDRVFQAHIEGRQHGYTARNTATHPPLEDLWENVKVMNQWYVDLSDMLSNEELSEPIHFEFIGGGEGSMTKGEMIMHVVNHSMYHRGFIGDMLYQVPVIPPATDLPVFLRDVPQTWK